jgi:hypothetical protein
VRHAGWLAPAHPQSARGRGSLRRVVVRRASRLAAHVVITKGATSRRPYADCVHWQRVLTCARSVGRVQDRHGRRDLDQAP